MFRVDEKSWIQIENQTHIIIHYITFGFIQLVIGQNSQKKIICVSLVIQILAKSSIA